MTPALVCRLIKQNIIARYGQPATLITDNATNLNNRMMTELCESFKIKHLNSTAYRPQMNGAVEAANKNIKGIIEKMTTRMAWDAAICTFGIPHFHPDMHWGYAVLPCLRHGSSTASRSRDPVTPHPARVWTGWDGMDPQSLPFPLLPSSSIRNSFLLLYIRDFYSLGKIFLVRLTKVLILFFRPFSWPKRLLYDWDAFSVA